MVKLLSSGERHRDLGLLVLRVGIGLSFAAHGWAKLMAGPERWVKIGSAVAQLGISGGHKIFGLLATAAELGGGALLVLGLATRLACLPLIATMFVAWRMHWARGDSYTAMSHAVEAGIVFVALFLTGPGRYSLDARLFGQR
jgi:putative oxidoreductase